MTFLNVTEIRVLVLAFAVVVGLSPSTASAEDVKGSQDHPMIQRYEGSEIVRYDTQEFTDYELFTKPATKTGGLAKNAEATKTLEGEYTLITYRCPDQRSTLEVIRNYQAALEGAGFETVFACKAAECGGRNFTSAIVEGRNNYLVIGESKEFRYQAAHLPRKEGDIYIALFVAMASTGGGPNYKRTMVQLEVLELRPIDEGMVTVDAGKMMDSISTTGRVALYGIYFDTNKATLRPESQPTLREIATLLNKNPQMKLVIVGHTDGTGSFEHNMGLSKDRAEAVRTALVGQYGIVANRLRAWGVGYLSPVATNQTEDGRAKNRRVELVNE